MKTFDVNSVTLELKQSLSRIRQKLLDLWGAVQKVGNHTDRAAAGSEFGATTSPSRPEASANARQQASEEPRSLAS